MLTRTSLSLRKSSLTVYMLAEIRSQRWPDSATTTGTTPLDSASSVISFSAVSRDTGYLGEEGSLSSRYCRYGRYCVDIDI